MTIKRFHTAICLTLFALAPLQVGAVSDGPLEQRLEQALGALGSEFVGHESVAVPEDGHPKKYLLLDFKSHHAAQQRERQERIHSICMQILKNRELVRSLSRDGFHMVSVAFNRRFQYDCL